MCLLTEAHSGELPRKARGLLTMLQSKAAEAPDDMTPEEDQTARIAKSLEQLLTATSLNLQSNMKNEQVKKCQAFLDKILQKLNQTCASAEAGFSTPSFRTFNITPTLQVPDWHWYHNIYTLLDICVLVSSVVEVVVTQNRSSKIFVESNLIATLADLRTTFRRMNDAFIEAARKLRQELQGSQSQCDVSEAAFGSPEDESDTIGKALRALVTDEESLGMNLTESWQEGLHGVIRTKIF